jgi:hypothetical protein
MNNYDLVVVSFYGGGQYYYDKAETLKEACRNISLDSCIEEIPGLSDLGWPSICRLKSDFFHRKINELKRPILWIDIDSDIRFVPDFLIDSKVDFSAFQRGFKDLTNFHSVYFSRSWAPSFLYFNYTEGGLKMTSAISEAAKNNKIYATDDYFLEEAWRKVGKDIVSLPIPRRFLSLNFENLNAAFEFGDSGNVPEYKSLVAQHENDKLGNCLAKNITKYINKTKNLTIKRYLFSQVHNLAVSDLDVLLKLATFGKSISPKYALKYAVQAANLYPRKYESQRLIFEILTKLGRRQDARQVLVDMLKCEYSDWRNFAKVKLNDLEVSSKINEASLEGRTSIKMWWAKTPHPGNFGDIVNSYLIEKMTGTPPTFCKRGDGMLAIGSVAKWANGSTIVWGSGASRSPETLSPLARYKAVRGPITRESVLRSGGYCPEIYGDPALLLPKYFNPKIKKRKKFKLGYIPHYQHMGIDFEGDHRTIDILRLSNKDVEMFITELCECEMILSTSLHGIILAHAYGIPAQWAVISNAEKQVHGDNSKFSDYFLGVGLDVQNPIDLSILNRIDSKEIRKMLPKKININFDAEKLINSFPYPDMLV